MKIRVLRTMVGLAAVLGSLLIASPAQAADGPDSARVYYPGISSGGIVSANLDFVSRTEVVYRNFTVRDVCPGDGRPVRAYIRLWDTSGVYRYSSTAKADTNGCGPDGTNFGTLTARASFAVGRAGLTVCVYTESAGNLRCVYSDGRDNPYT